MQNEKLGLFIRLLAQQTAGAGAAIDQIKRLNPSLEDGYCLFNLHDQWSLAFDYQPGRIEALPLIYSLAKKLTGYPSDDTGKMFDEAEWKALVQLRGPVEKVLFSACEACGAEVVSMGTSGFYDAVGLICSGCGNVYFKSTYDDGPTPLCACGKEYQTGCTKCGKPRGKIRSEGSPFEYFAKHSFVRGTGA